MPASGAPDDLEAVPDDLAPVDIPDDLAPVEAEAKPEPRDDFGEGAGLAVIEGAADAIPGTSQVGAALRTLPEVGKFIATPNKYTGSDILTSYQRHKAEQEARSHRAQTEHPVAYLGGNLPAAVGAGLATGGATKLAPMATDVALAAAQGANTGDNSPEAIGTNVIGGRVIGGAIGAVMHPVKAIGALLEMPQQALEEAYKRFGGTRLAQLIDDAERTPAGKWAGLLLSRRLQSLTKNIDAPGQFVPNEHNFAALENGPLKQPAQLSRDLALAAERGDATLGNGSSFTAKPGAGIEDDLYAVQRKSLDHAANSELGHGSAAHAMPFTMAEYKADDLLRRSNAPVAKQPIDVSYKPRTKPVADPDLVPSGEDWDTQEWRDGFAGGTDKRLGMRNDPKWTERAIDTEVYRAQQAKIREQAANKAEYAEKAAALRERIARGSKMASEERTTDIEGVVSEAKKWQQKIQKANAEAATVDAGNIMERERLSSIAEQAQNELNQINTGRRATEKLAGAKAGLGGGMILGAVGFKAGLPVGRAADLLGAVGQRMGNADIANVTAMAQQWATRNDALGRAAQWALSGEGDQALVRMYTLANMPEAQAETGIER